MSITRTARYRVRPEALNDCLRAIREFVAYVAANEPGTLAYTALQDAEDPTSFLHVFTFQDEAAEERHASSDAVQRFTGVLYPATTAPVRFSGYRDVASTNDTRPSRWLRTARETGNRVVYASDYGLKTYHKR